jgi:hypothetical protein
MNHHVIGVVMAALQNITPNAVFARSPSVGWQASCVMMIS